MKTTASHLLEGTREFQWKHPMGRDLYSDWAVNSFIWYNIFCRVFNRILWHKILRDSQKWLLFLQGGIVSHEYEVLVCLEYYQSESLVLLFRVTKFYSCLTSIFIIHYSVKSHDRHFRDKNKYIGFEFPPTQTRCCANNTTFLNSVSESSDILLQWWFVVDLKGAFWLPQKFYSKYNSKIHPPWKTFYLRFLLPLIW